MTRILVVHYSQTGQLTRVVRSLMTPLATRSDVRVDWHEVVPVRPYPFPWGLLSFLDAFPESVYLDPPAVRAAGFAPDAQYDLIVLAYQVWFLSPSLPITGFLRSPAAQVLKGKPVVTVVGCRNMWATAHRTMSALLGELGAHQVDNVVLTDQGPTWLTFLTTPWWLLTGNKGPLLGIFPEAGISGRDIDRAARFGRALGDAVPAIQRGETGPFLRGLEAVKANRFTLMGERIGHRSFRVWGRLVRAAGPPGAALRKPILIVYAVFLITAILTILPITATLATIVARLSRRLTEEAASLERPSGSSGERLAIYDRP
jgi:hypothetical protein